MRDVSKVLLRGMLTEPPRTRTFDDGRKVVNLNVKTVTMENDDTGALRERPAWHRVSVRGQRNVEVAEGMAADTPVYVEGRLRTRKYQKDGEDMYATEISADIVKRPENPEPHLNRSLILGNLGRAPELREYPSFVVMNLRIATNETWTRRDGETGEETEWHQVAVFGDPARRLDGQLEKGQRAFAEGYLQSRKYTDKTGRERRATETRAHIVFSSGDSRQQRGYDDAASRAGGSDRREKEKPKDPWGASGAGSETESSGMDTGGGGEDPVPF